MSRCLYTWPAGKNFPLAHRCWEPVGHAGPHRCICGYQPDETDKDNSKPDDADREPTEAELEHRAEMVDVPFWRQV